MAEQAVSVMGQLMNKSGFLTAPMGDPLGIFLQLFVLQMAIPANLED
jgi:hypothetical protein